MILFCEYYITEADRDSFRDWARSAPGRWQGAELLENVGQPGIFVEIWRCADEAELVRREKERREGHSGWDEMEDWVRGGREGLRLWAFRPVIG